MVNSSGAETGIFCNNLVNIMLSPWLLRHYAKSSHYADYVSCGYLHRECIKKINNI